MRLVRTEPMSSDYVSTANESFEVFKKYQTKIHGERKVTMKQYTRFLVKSPLQVNLYSVCNIFNIIIYKFEFNIIHTDKLILTDGFHSDKNLIVSIKD